MSTKPMVTNFDLWKKAHNVVLMVFKITARIKEQDKIGFIEAFRQCAIEVVNQITFAYYEKVPKERIVFYKNAGSEVERLKYFCILARDLGYLKEKAQIFDKVEEIGRIIYSNIYKFSKDLK